MRPGAGLPHRPPRRTRGPGVPAWPPRGIAATLTVNNSGSTQPPPAPTDTSGYTSVLFERSEAFLVADHAGETAERRGSGRARQPGRDDSRTDHRRGTTLAA